MQSATATDIQKFKGFNYRRGELCSPLIFFVGADIIRPQAFVYLRCTDDAALCEEIKQTFNIPLDKSLFFGIMNLLKIKQYP